MAEADSNYENWQKGSKKDVWQTPESLYSIVDETVGIDLDPCAGKETDIAETNWCIQNGQDGLVGDWHGIVFVNPPFSEKGKWLDKIHEQIENTELIVLVTPDSTGVKSWWHGDIVPYADYVWFSEGRVRYIDPEKGESTGSPGWNTALSFFGNVPAELFVRLREEGWLVHEAGQEQTSELTLEDAESLGTPHQSFQG